MEGTKLPRTRCGGRRSTTCIFMLTAVFSRNATAAVQPSGPPLGPQQTNRADHIRQHVCLARFVDGSRNKMPAQHHPHRSLALLQDYHLRLQIQVRARRPGRLFTPSEEHPIARTEKWSGEKIFWKVSGLTHGKRKQKGGGVCTSGCQAVGNAEQAKKNTERGEEIFTAPFPRKASLEVSKPRLGRTRRVNSGNHPAVSCQRGIDGWAEASMPWQRASRTHHHSEAVLGVEARLTRKEG